MCRQAYWVWIRRPLSLGEFSVWIRAKPYRPPPMSNQRIGHVIGWTTVGVRQGRIIFGPDNAYLRDQWRHTPSLGCFRRRQRFPIARSRMDESLARPPTRLFLSSYANDNTHVTPVEQLPATGAE